MKKRIIALILSLLMLAGNFSFTAAEETAEEAETPVQTAAAEAAEEKAEAVPETADTPKTEAAAEPEAPEAEEPAAEESAAENAAEQAAEETQTQKAAEEAAEAEAEAAETPKAEADSVTIAVKKLSDVRLSDGGASWTVSAEASDGSALSYRWQSLDASAEYEDAAERETAWTDLAGETGKKLVFENVTDYAPYEDLLFRCRVTAGGTTVYTDEVRLLKETAAEAAGEAEVPAAEETPEAEETAAEEAADEAFVPCTLTEGCTLAEGHEGECVLAEETADEAFVPCTLTEGCTLAAGHEGECVLAEEAADALPYGLKGLPEDYTLSASQLALKEDARAHDIAGDAAEADPGTDFVKKEIVFAAESKAEAELFAEAYSAELISYGNGVAVAKLSDATVAEAVACGADADTDLPAVEPNYIVSVSPISSSSRMRLAASSGDVSADALETPQKTSWSDYSSGDPFLEDPSSDTYQWQHDMVDSYEAWTVTKGSSSVKVGVLDTGVKADHPDLAGRVTVVALNGGGSNEDDSTGHGTHVAGIIAAALGNGEGGAGIAPGVSIYSYNVLPNNGSGTYAQAVAGINRAVKDGMYIINMSLGGYWYSAIQNAAVQNAYKNGCVIVAAMGNDGTNTVSYPAAYDHVIAVGAVDKNGKRAYFSNYGSWCDISAPGVSILSTGKSYSYNYGGYYRVYSGTSQATPVVSGVLALYMSKAGRCGYSKALAKLKSTAQKCSSSGMGAGIVNAARLFSTDKTAPEIVVSAGASVITNFKYAVPYESTAAVLPGTDATNDAMIVWSVNKAPAVKGGVVTVGTEYDGEIELKQWAGKTITLYAACINALGKLGTASSVKLKVAANPSPEAVTLSGPQMVISGNAVTYKAVTTPADAAQTVKWKIEDLPACAKKTTVSGAGVLKAVTTEACTVTLTITSKADDMVTASMQVLLMPAETRTLKLAAKTLKLEKGGTADLGAKVYRVVKKSKTLLDPDAALDAGGYELSYKSSKPGVATVSADGTVTAVGSGTAKITVTLLDGSASAVTCTVTVTEPVEALSLGIPELLAVGGSFTPKAAVTPATATNKAVEWTVTGAAKLKNGKVVPVTGAQPGDTAVVTAAAKDGSGVTASKTVTIAAAPYIRLDAADPYYKGVSYGTDDTGSVNEVTLFTVDLADTARDETVFPLDVVLMRGGVTLSEAERAEQLQLTSSDPSVVTVSADGTLRAVKKGTAKITCKAADGSGVKKTVAVSVRVPASSLTIASSLPRMMYDSGIIAAGCSATHTVSFGDGYGKPSTKASDVRWYFTVCDADTLTEITSTAIRKCFTFNAKTGKLTVKSGIAAFGRDIEVEVGAYATDGSGVSGTYRYTVAMRKTTILYATLKTFYGDVENGTAMAMLRTDAPFLDFTVTSSAPLVASFTNMERSDPTDRYMYIDFACNKRGTAVITVKANDGTGKTCTFSIKVE